MNQNRTTSALSDFAARLRKFMAAAAGQAERSIGAATSQDERIFEELALDLFTLQFAHNEAYRKFCEFRGPTPHKIAHWSEIPAIPPTAFKELDLTSIPRAERKVAFQSSGTTNVTRSRHSHSAESLALYEA